MSIELLTVLLIPLSLFNANDISRGDLILFLMLILCDFLFYWIAYQGGFNFTDIFKESAFTFIYFLIKFLI